MHKIHEDRAQMLTDTVRSSGRWMPGRWPWFAGKELGGAVLAALDPCLGPSFLQNQRGTQVLLLTLFPIKAKVLLDFLQFVKTATRVGFLQKQSGMIQTFDN